VEKSVEGICFIPPSNVRAVHEELEM